MANKLYNQLNPNTSGNIGSVMSQNQNTKQILQPKKKPTIADIIREVQEYGGDARGLFYMKAKQMGVDPETILSQIK